MKINVDALKALELKLAEYSKANGSIAEHDSANNNRCNGCAGTCHGLCHDDVRRAVLFVTQRGHRMKISFTGSVNEDMFGRSSPKSKT